MPLNEPKLTLGELCIKLLLPQLLQHNPLMLGMLLMATRVHQDIINEFNNERVKIRLKTLFIRCMNATGALVSPKDLTRYS